jgi:hypothetical protein
MSQVIPPGILLSPDVSRQTKDASIQQASSLSDRRPDIVRADEKRFRALGWKVFREQLEVFADEVVQYLPISSLMLMMHQLG